MSNVALRLDWCDYKAAKWACEHWHYSQSMPAGKNNLIGAWEGGKFIGAVIFGHGANNRIGSPYGLKQTQVVELTRVALTDHETPVSRIVSIAMKIIRKHNPGVRLIVSYADPRQGHVGSIYQAMGWVYVGSSKAQKERLINGEIVHKRSVFGAHGTVKGFELSEVLWKHKYLYPLDVSMQAQIAPLSKPYPKKCAGSADSGTGGDQPSGDGANPIPALSEGGAS